MNPASQKPKSKSQRNDSKKMSIRTIHQKRDWKIRETDEKTTEEITSDKDKWKADPIRYDFEHVDTKIPENMELTFEENSAIGIFSLETESESSLDDFKESVRDYAEDEFGYSSDEINSMDLEDLVRNGIMEEDEVAEYFSGQAGYLRFEKMSSFIHLDAIHIEPFFRGEGLGNILLRELTKYADENKLNISLTAQPFEIERFGLRNTGYEEEIETPEYTKEETINLVNFYKEFGFEPTDKMSKVDDYSGVYAQKMYRKHQ